MFSFFKRRNEQMPIFTYFTNFWRQPSRGVLLKSNPQKFVKFTRKLPLWSTSLALWSCLIKSLQHYKEGLHYGCFHGENFQNGFYTKTVLDICSDNFNLTLQSYWLHRTLFIKYVHRGWTKLYVKEKFHL